MGFRVEWPPAERVTGEWDRSRLEQVLVNLIDNAFKYGNPDGSVDVALSLNRSGSAREVHLVVRDDGIGIPPGELERIFRPFARAQNASAQHFPGLGLGLAVAKQIVELHGGRIWAESVGPDQGSAFYMVLPGVVEG